MIDVTRPTSTPQQEVERLRDVLDHLLWWTTRTKIADHAAMVALRSIIVALREPRSELDPQPESRP